MQRLIFDNEEQWLEARNDGIGGSDIVKIMGFYADLYPDATPLAVWQDKKGLSERADKEVFKRGKILEPSLMEFYRLISTQGFVEHLEYEMFIADNPILRCSPDGLTYIDYSSYINKIHSNIVEGKTTNSYLTESDFTDPRTHKLERICQAYYTQAQWNAGICEAEQAVIVWLNGHLEFGYIVFNTDWDYVGMLQEKALEFWDKYIRQDVPPPAMTVWDTLQLFPEFKPKTVALATNEHYSDYLRLKELETQQKGLKDEIEAIRNNFKIYMQDNEELQFYGQTLFKRLKNNTYRKG